MRLRPWNLLILTLLFVPVPGLLAQHRLLPVSSRNAHGADALPKQQNSAVPMRQTRTATPEATDAIVEKVVPSLAVISRLDVSGRPVATATAVIVRPEGVLFAPYHLVKDASAIQVRLTSGEVYDRPEVIAFDQRRDVAALRISAIGLRALPFAQTGSIGPGDPVSVVYNSAGLGWIVSTGTYRGMQLADEIPGAGTGYQILQHTVPLSAKASGGVLVDREGRLLGILVEPGDQSGKIFTVPIETVAGLASGKLGAGFVGPTSTPAPAPVPSISQKPAVAETARPAPQTLPAASSTDPAEILRTFRTFYVDSDTIFMEQEVLEEALMKRPEFAAWGLQPLKSRVGADVVITITLPFLSWEWNYKLIRQGSGVELGAGMVQAAIQDTAAPELAELIVTRIGAFRPLPSRHGPVTIGGKWWNVKYASGDEKIEPDKQFALTVNSERIFAREEGNELFSIPVNSVIAVAYSNEVKNPSDPWFSFWSNANIETPEQAAGALALMPIVMIAGAILDSMKTTQHFIRIDWRENEVLKNIVLRVDESDYPALLAELNSVTHKKWMNVPELAANLLHELRSESHRRVHVFLASSAYVGWKELASGSYDVVLLESAGKPAEAYFLPPDWEAQPQKIAQAVVQVEEHPAAPGQQSQQPPVVSYKTRNGINLVAEIRTAEFTVRFSAVPLTDVP